MFSLGFLNKQFMTNELNKQIILRNMILPFVCFLSSSLIIFFVAKTSKLNKLFKLSLLLIISFQLLYSARKYLPFAPKQIVFPATPVLDELQELKFKQTEPFRVEINDVTPQNFLMPYEIEAGAGYDTLMPISTGQFFSILRKNEIDEKIARVQWTSFFDSPYYPLTNEKYILVKKIIRDGVFGEEGEIKERFNDKRYKTIFFDKTVVVLEDSKYLPRAFFVNSLIYAQNNNDFIEKSKNIDFSKTAIIGKENNLIKDKKENNNTTIDWTTNKPNEIALNLMTEKPAFLVLLNNYYKGWRVFLDEKETQIIKTNYTFQGVFIPEGKHSLVFKYEPFSFKVGKLFSIIFISINMVLLIISKIYYNKKHKL
jgi:hypothetical protein